MMSMKRNTRCKLALLLLLVLLIPSIPVTSVSAAGGSPFPFDYPSTDTFYPVDFVIKLFNVDSASYLRVRTSTSQQIASWQGILDMYTIALLPDPFSKYTYYDSAGNVVSDPFAGTSSENLELIRSESNDHMVDIFGVVIASNSNLYTYPYGGGPLEDSEVYFYANYVSLAVTPTPTPIPTVAPLQSWFDYPELPSNFSSSTLCILKTHSDGINDGQLIGLTFVGNSAAFNYPTFYKDRSPWNYRSQALIDNAITINTWTRYGWNFSTFTVNYNNETDSYSVGYNLNSLNQAPIDDAWYTSNKLDWNGETLCCWSLVPNNPLTVTGQQAGTYANSPQSWFEILFTNHNITPGTSENPNVSPTPTPNPSPTLMPQPTTEPTVEPPDEGDDNNWTGLFGWLKRIRDSILSIPKKIASGILNALKYIFIPDSNKVKQVFNTVKSKFSVLPPDKFTVNPNELFRPRNVVWKFHPISLNGEDTEDVDITLIDFEMVDNWLDSTEGRVITRILQAVFAIVMFAYLIYIFTKHIATVNYTDAHTLMHLDDPPKGGKGP